MTRSKNRLHFERSACVWVYRPLHRPTINTYPRRKTSLPRVGLSVCEVNRSTDFRTVILRSRSRDCKSANQRSSGKFARFYLTVEDNC